ncbi:hypothetical protein T310_8772, partial [Rasamsonia emersonii CBS 393.64]
EIQLRIFPRVMRPASLLPSGPRTGSWSNPLSLMSSMAVSQVSLDRIVVTGFNLSDLTLAADSGSLFPRADNSGEVGAVSEGSEGSRSFAASQSSSAN